MITISRFSFCSCVILAAFSAQISQAQVGNNNPTGPSGIFNGDITTAGSYDPYTGNITRTITDISVAGTVGTLPLAFSRIYNSRNTDFIDFGIAGFWRHNYHWFIENSATKSFTSQPGPFSPTSYSVNFPDGRWETFTSSTFDTYYRAPAGTADRFIPLNTTTSLAYLVFPDGSKLELLGTEHIGGSGNSWSAFYSYTAQALIDPYGLRTTFTYNPDGTLQKITEPGGRYIQLYYQGNGVYVDHVTASDGRTVQYYYATVPFAPTYTCLDHVVYFGDATLTARYQYCASNSTQYGTPLLYTCDDPMYPGPMHRIAYVYRTTNNPDGTQRVYGQVSSENYFDGTNVGAALTTLTVNNSTTRTETRADGKTRTFTYSASGLLTSCTDFKGVSASQAYDTHSYINAVTDRNNHTTNYTLNALSGGLLTVTFPATPNDTPVGTPRGVVTYTYGWATCPDVNNRDANNPYYLYSVTDEGGHATVFTRDTSKRVTRIDYPDGGYETFSYNSFNEVLSHVMKTGGTESFTYDARGLKQTYRSPDNPTGNATASYQYDSLDRVSGVTDVLGATVGDADHTTSYTYTSRGQLYILTRPNDPNDHTRHTVTNHYNPDGTLSDTTDELGHQTTFTYDDYRRPLTKQTPQRFTGDSTPRTTYTYYDSTGTGNDYTHTDSNVTYLKLPSGKKVKSVYDENYRKTSVTASAADGSTDAATTSYGYDNVGNVTSVVSPKEQTGQQYAGKSTTTVYDERNRPYSITDALIDPPTTIQYNAAGQKQQITRPNGQLTTFDSYDSMNRLLQQTVRQTPDPDAITKYTYYTSGLLKDFQDPHISSNASLKYTYVYDAMGRKTSLTYPPATSASPTPTPGVESWHYDTAGRNDTFTNRNGKTQTFTYDSFYRPTNVAWNDGGVTPTVTFVYDAASRVASIANSNATITRAYFNDNLLNTETTTYPLPDNVARTVTYSYDADGNRAILQYPANTYNFTYGYTGRNQLNSITNTSGGSSVISYGYDVDGNLSSRTPNNSTSSSYSYDAMDRAIGITHTLVSGARTFAYAYDSVGNRKWTKRDSGNGDVFGYDAADQSTSVLLNVANPDTTAPGVQTIFYDPNGNRTSFTAYGTTDTYSTNNLNEYTTRNTSNAVYNNDGDITTGLDGSTYTYDAQNRLLTATKGSSTETFVYDGLNRQVSRKIGAASPMYNVYDGWDLIGEYNGGSTTPLTAYLHGPGGLVKLMTFSSTYYYYQDASGCTSHLSDNTGHLVESYRYDLQGTPIVYDASNNLRSGGSIYGIRHLFTGQQWYSDIALYDLRNRFYSPDIGRFLQPDPVGFGGDATSLYRYCGNNPLTRVDASGTRSIEDRGHGGGHFIDVVARFASQGITLPGDDYCNLDGSQGGSPLSEGCLTGYNAGWAFLSSPEWGGNWGFAVPAEPTRLIFPSQQSTDGDSVDTQATTAPPTNCYALMNGQVFYNVADLSAALASTEAGTVESLIFVGHGFTGSPTDPATGIQIGFNQGLTYVCGYNGYLFTFNGTTSVNDLFAHALSSDAAVYFLGCNTAYGGSNLCQAFSEAFPGTLVAGYNNWGAGQVAPGGTILSWHGNVSWYQAGTMQTSSAGPIYAPLPGH